MGKLGSNSEREREEGRERGELDNKKYERYDNKVLSIKIIVHCTLYNL